MIGKTTRLVSVAAVSAIIVLAGFAEAATVNQIIAWPPSKDAIGSDESRQDLLDTDGDGIIDQGESFHGIFDVTTIQTVPFGQPPNPQVIMKHGAGNSEWTGEFQIMVVQKNAIMNPITGLQEVEPISGFPLWQFIFGPDPAFDTNNVGTMIRMYEDPMPGISTYQPELQPKANAIGTAIDGAPYWAIGLPPGSQGAYVAVGPDVLAALQAFPPAQRIATSAFALDRTADTVFGMGGFQHVLAPQTDVYGNIGEVIGSSEIGGPLPQSLWDLSDNTNMQLTVVPLPPAIWGGIGLFGLGVLVRLRRRFF